MAAQDERSALLDALTSVRTHLLDVVLALDQIDLRRPMLPSGWTCLGMVNHLAVDVERFWFRGTVAGDAAAGEPGSDAWQVGDDVPVAEIVQRYRDEAAYADDLISAHPLDMAPRWWPSELFPDLPPRTLRRTVLHVITETAIHAGHLDAAVELLDGRQRLVLS